jgi:hypothetical protein
MVETASERAHAVNPGELPPDFGFAAGEQLELIDLYGTGAVPAAALAAFHRASALDDLFQGLVVIGGQGA